MHEYTRFCHAFLNKFQFCDCPLRAHMVPDQFIYKQVKQKKTDLTAAWITVLLKAYGHMELPFLHCLSYTANEATWSLPMTKLATASHSLSVLPLTLIVYYELVIFCSFLKLISVQFFRHEDFKKIIIFLFITYRLYVISCFVLFLLCLWTHKARYTNDKKVKLNLLLMRTIHVLCIEEIQPGMATPCL